MAISVSRTYDVMFYAAEAALLTKGLVFSSHKGVMSGFAEHFIKTGLFPKEMSRELGRAFEKRQLCDYESDPAISLDDARHICEKATDYVNVIGTWLAKH
jgi:uncharacterized protein (UPF0332 family)